jgi:unsaturated rhamnogalacturonyl hydrolase
MAAGFQRGVTMGILEADPFASHAERAWQAACARVDEHGILTGVSAAVWASTVREHYHYVPTGFLVPWGQGPLILAAYWRERQEEGREHEDH